jgi:hypothetical protein
MHIREPIVTATPESTEFSKGSQVFTLAITEHPADTTASSHCVNQRFAHLNLEITWSLLHRIISLYSVTVMNSDYDFKYV